PRLSFKLRGQLGDIVKFGLIAMFSNISYFVMQTADSLMVADMVSLGKAGIYTTVVYLAAFMLFPSRALINVTAPRIAEYWKEGDIGSIHKLYKRVSFLLLIVGLLIFFGIWINRYNIFALMKPEFIAGLWPLLFLLLARLVDMVTGLNSFIIVTSDKFKYDLIFNLFLLFLVIQSNLIFIREYGATGAAIATFLAVFIFNGFRVVFLYYMYRIHPFQLKMLLPILFAGIAFGADFLLPRMSPVFLDIAVRSILFTGIFGGLVLYFKVSPDINRFLVMILGRLGIRIPGIKP
ncbi:MAG: oligosaccharide flippase family protein, partial [Bacteroidota bacterium]